MLNLDWCGLTLDQSYFKRKIEKPTERLTMTQDKTGGAAFPHVPTFKVGNNGMTLRDYFAGQAIAGLLDRNNAEKAAEVAYHVADAMIAEREKAGQPESSQYLREMQS
jgi:pyridoxal/pyridoxine/pyridoxamine kinase